MTTRSLSPADFPQSPDTSNRLLIALALLAAGFVLGVVAETARTPLADSAAVTATEDWHGNVRRSVR